MALGIAYAPVGGTETVLQVRNPLNQSALSSGVTSFPLAPPPMTPYRFRAFSTVAGERTSAAVILPAEADTEYSLDGLTNWVATLNLGKADATGVFFWQRQTGYVTKANESHVIGPVAYGGFEIAPQAPVIVSLATTSVTSAAATVAYAVSDPNGDALTTTYAVVARGATPSSWTATASSPITKTGLTANTDYDFYLRTTDGTFTTTSEPLQFKTLEATSTAPSFSTQPRLKAGTQTSQGFTVEAGISNPGALTLTHELSLDNGVTYYPATATLNGTSGLYEIPVTNQQSGAKLVVWKVIGGSYTITSSPASIATGTLAAPSVTATAGNAKVTLTWAAVTGAASYNLYTSTSSTAPTSGTTPMATGVTSPRDVTGLTNGTPQHSWVQSVDAAGNKTWSAVATATPQSLFTETFDSLTAWTKEYQAGATAAISGGKFTFSGPSTEAVYTYNTPGASVGDCLVQMDIIAGATLNYKTLARTGGTNGTLGYSCMYQSDIKALSLWYKDSAGTNHQLGAFQTLASHPASIGIKVVGTGSGSNVKVSAFYGGSAHPSLTDQTYLTEYKDNGKVGIDISVSSSVTASADNFTVTIL